MGYWIAFACVVLVSFIIGLLYQLTTGWQMGNMGLSLSFKVIAPFMFSMASLTLAIVYYLTSGRIDPLQMVCFAGLPIIFLVYYFTRVSIMHVQLKNTEKKEAGDYSRVQAWVKSFPFLHHRDVRVSTYYARGELSGHIHIECQMQEQKEIVELLVPELPGNIHVSVRLMEASKWAHLQSYRGWIEQFSILEGSIKDEVYYDENRGLYGHIYILTDKEKVDIIREKLPKGIELVLCLDPEKFGLLINLREHAIGSQNQHIYVKLA